MEWKNKTALAAMALSLVLALVDVQSCHLETSQRKNGNFTLPAACSQAILVLQACLGSQVLLQTKDLK